MEKSILVAVTISLIMFGCGGDDEVTEEVDAVISEIQSTVTLFANPVVALSERFDARAQSTSTTTVDSSVQCTKGGFKNVVGSLTQSTSGNNSPVTIEDMFELTTEYNNCKFTGSSGETFTLNGTLTPVGSSSTIFTFDEPVSLASITSIEGSYTVRTTGTVDVVGPNISISDCDVDLTQDISYSTPKPYTVMNSWHGTVCGSSTSGSVTTHVNDFE